MTSSPIAIVGIGARFAKAKNLQEFWERSLAGEHTFEPVPADRWDHASFFDANPRSRDRSYAPTGAWVDEVQTFPAIALQMPPRRAEVMDPQQRLALEVSLAAIEDSGRSPEELPRNTGVYMGVTAVEYRVLSSGRLMAQMMLAGAFGRPPEDPEVQKALAASVENLVAARPYSAPGVLANMIAATVTQELRLKGPSFTTDAACASSLVALDSAMKALRDGSVEVALAGGVYLCVTPEHHVAFSRIGAISKSGVCRPFDQRADGFVQGDGCGILMLKRLADAERDGDRIYGVIHGIGSNNDGGSAGPMAPVKEGQIEVVEKAWADAKVSPRHLGYIETHGTGTLVGDATEFEGLAAALAEKMAGGRAGLGSSKANFGHTMSAAGVCGVIRAVLAMHHNVVPPMANFESPKADLPLAESPFFIPKEATPWTDEQKLACVSSFGFGGTNVHVVLGNLATVPRSDSSIDDRGIASVGAALHGPTDAGAPGVGAALHGPTSAGAHGVGAALRGRPGVETAQAELVLMSAPDETTLRHLAGLTARAIARDPHATVAGVARAWAKKRRQAHRLAVVAANKEDLVNKLAAFGDGEFPKGTAYGVAPEHAPKVAFLFPGQGAQRVGMIRGIKDRFAPARRALAEMDLASAEVMDRPVSHYLYPELSGRVLSADEALAELTETHITQPALFAVGHALTEVLRSVGVRPVVVAGHSVGEFTAAAAAGLTSAGDGLKWCARRGQGMQRHIAPGGDKGAMAAWVADRKQAEPHLVAGCVIANANHPRQVVVSGASDAVAAANAKARAAGIEVTELRVSHAFHSPIFEAMDLSADISKIEFLDARDNGVVVASCIADKSYADPETAREVFTRHARSPVLWTDALARCVEAGAELFLQVGAGGPLLSFVRGTLPGAKAISLAGKEDDDGGASLLEGLGQLFVHGVEVDPTSITGLGPLASVPPVVLPRERYWIVGDHPVDPVHLVTKGGGKVKADAQAPKPAVKAESREQKPEVKVETKESDPLHDIVYAAVAKASAYPRAALKGAMKLGDDLGFDSMMVADLAEELRKNIPGFVGIPQELLINAPTIDDILAFAKSPAATAQKASVDDNAPLSAFSPRWVAAALQPYGVASLDLKTVHVVGEARAELAGLGLAPAFPQDADLIVCVAPSSPPVSAVLSGEAAVVDPAASLIATLDEAAGGGGAHLLVLANPNDPWAEALAGVARSAAREWSDRVVKVLWSTEALSADILKSELSTFDRSVDVLYVDGVRFVAGTAPLEAASTWEAKGQLVVITGGTRGIGRKLGERLAASGAEVVLVGRSAPDGVLPERVRFVAADVTVKESVVAALADLAPTTLIHSAGVLADGPLGTVSAELGRAARVVKVDGLVHAIQACGPSLSRVLALGSWAGRFGNRAQSHYAAGNAAMAAVVANLPSRIVGVTAEFGPWADSDMVRSIPAAIVAQMRAEGVDFVGDEAGLEALVADLGRTSSGIVIHGRSVPAVVRSGRRQVVLSTATHPFLKDHAVPSEKGPVPVFPIASAASLIAETANLGGAFEVSGLTLFQGVAVHGASDPLMLECVVRGEQAEIRQGDKRILSYQAKVSAPQSYEVPPPLSGGEAPTLPLARFYGGLTFHGKLLQGITHIDGVGEGFVRGRVKTSAPAQWIVPHALSGQSQWAIDPLAFDSAMQLAAYVAWVRYQRAGTPVGFQRFVQLEPWPMNAELIAEARFSSGDTERQESDLVFRDPGSGKVVALAFGVAADMKKVEHVEDKAEPEFVAKAEWTDPSQWKGYKDLAMRLHAVSAMGLKNPYFDVHQGTARNTSRIDGREVINYSSYNYIGLSGDERVIAEVFDAIKKYGTSVSASRVASGERPFHRELEAALAKAHGCDDALVMAGGHATNVNTIGHIFNNKDLILHDELIHDSCLQGIKLSGAARRSFKHEDVADLERQLKELRRHYEKVLILVEGVYSMDGDITNLPEYVRLKKQYACMLMVDEAHSFGTIGRRGCGVGEHFGMDDADSPERAKYGLVRSDVDIWMGTMSKSLSSMGGWVAGRKELITYLRYTTPGFVFAAGIPPALGQAALSSLNYMLAEPERVARLQHNCKRFYELLAERGIDTGPARGESPVIPVITGDSMWALKLSERLLDLGVSASSIERGEKGPGINAKPIIFPAVANDAARLRFFMTSLHTEEQLVYTADAIKRTLDQIREEAPKKPAKAAKA